jgi:Caspase domain
MKNILPLILLLLINGFSATSQSVYDLSFTYPAGDTLIAYKAIFIDYNNGKGQARLLFNAPKDNNAVLVNFDVAEEIAETNTICNNGDRVYYKLQNPQFIESKDPGISFPEYLCFKKDVITGLYEPMGVAASSTDCKTDVVKFSQVTVLQQKDITKALVLTYFKPYDLFYRNIFVTNNAKDLTTDQRNVKLYLLFVANVTDTLIGTANSKDMYDAIKFFGKVKEFLGISAFIYDTITRTNFNKQTVINKINSLNPGDKDIVVFYYAGHGYRKSKDGRPGPYIDLRDLLVDKQKSYLDNSLSTEDIAELIKKKGARLNLIIGDCCNDTVTKTNPIVKEPATSGKKGGFEQFWSTQKCRDLFLNANPTTILAAAASPYQLAISNPVFGGYFSNHFINTIETNLSLAAINTKPTWDDIFNQVKQQTEYKAAHTWCDDARTIKCNRQRPYVNIVYGRF